ncbi:NACHT, LRR and PYD domains-containing protein 1a allele 5-like isoform 1-T2 [Clarias gariepinus]
MMAPSDVKCKSDEPNKKNKLVEDARVPEQLENMEKMVAGSGGGHLEINMKFLTSVEEKSNERRMKGVEFINFCSFIFKSIRVFWFTSELELLPVWNFTHLPRVRLGFPRVFNFPPTSDKYTGPETVSPKTDTAAQESALDLVELEDRQRKPELKYFMGSAPVHKDILKGLQSSSVFQKQPTEDSISELFTPELVETFAEDRNKGEYRFICPHAGQFKCKLTNLVFEMEAKGEVLYSIVSWDHNVLDGLLSKEPAGPLYSIECLKGLIRHLHLPHCETRTDVVKLTVAHLTDRNVEIIQLLKVTDTHVIIQVHGLSLFGVLKALLFQAYPTRAQVLLFYKQLTRNHMRNKLHIHLLPGNVPVTEVQKQHDCNQYIETSSKCQLTPGKTYKPCCKTTVREYVPQPEDDTFEYDFGPNYHPTFEVFFNTKVDVVTLSLEDENGQEVWRPRQVLLAGTEAASTKLDLTDADFVDTHRDKLIQSVGSVLEIADYLIASRMITEEMYSNIQAATTSQDKMRALYSCLTTEKVKVEFYKILREKQPCLVEELESPSDQD